MEVIDTVNGYRLIHLMAQGGMSEVFKAVHPSKGRAAIKFIRKDLIRVGEYHLERWLRQEALITRDLRGRPHIVGYREHGEIGKRQFLVMEMVPGRLLKHVRLRPHAALKVGMQLCVALRALRRTGIVHGDIKPENVMGRDLKTPRVELIDFGLSHFIAKPNIPIPPMCVFGTPEYMGPEHRNGTSKNGPESDMFSLGCTLYEILTGDEMFTDDDFFKSLDAKQRPRPISSPHPSIPKHVWAVLRIMTDPEPSKRPTPIQAGNLLRACLEKTP